MQKISEFTIPMHLRARDVVLAAKAARLNGTLQCLVSPGYCSYWDDKTETRCAIGQAFTPEVARKLQEKVGWGMGSIGSLINAGTITTDDPDVLQKLQQAHDLVTGIFEFRHDSDTSVLVGLNQATIDNFDRVIEQCLTQGSEA